MSKSSTPTSVDSTAMARAATHGRLRWVWSWPASMVVTRLSSNAVCSKKRNGFRAGITAPMPSVSLGSTVIPNVGQRGALPSGRSKVSIGKFDSTPPSIRVDVEPSTPVSDRAIEEQDRHRGAHRVGHRLLVGVQAVEPPKVPREPHQLRRCQVGDGDHQLVAPPLEQAVVVEVQIAEAGDPEVLQLAADPVVGHVAAVHAGIGDQPQAAPR